MKRILHLVLIFILCLVFSGCGKTAEAAEITADNWQTYFTIEYKETWTQNDFQEYDNLKIDAVLALKPEYLSRLAENEDNRITLEFRCDGAVKGADIDFAAQTYTIGAHRKTEPFQQIHTLGTGELLQPFVLTDGTLEPVTIDGIRYILVFENGSLERIQGTLYFYSEE